MADVGSLLQARKKSDGYYWVKSDMEAHVSQLYFSYRCSPELGSGSLVTRSGKGKRGGGY